MTVEFDRLIRNWPQWRKTP